MVEDIAAGSYRPTWKNRRRVIFGALIFIALMQIYIASPYAGDKEVHVVQAIVLAGLAALIIPAYIGWSAWDDKNIMQTLTSLKR